MWPWAHLGVGYLAYSALHRYRTGRRPGAGPALAVAVGTQAPDLVDKPLGWYLGVLPGGRSLAHSAVVAALVLAVLGVLARRRGRVAAWLAFAVGYLTHLAGDAVVPLFAGPPEDLAFLAWPLVSLPARGAPPTAADVVRSMTVTPWFTCQLGLFVLGGVLWARQGYPGLGAVRGRFGALADRAH